MSLEQMLTVLLALVPSAMLAFVYPRLPEQVPLHWGITLQPDMVGSKVWLWAVMALLAFPTLLVAFVSPERPLLALAIAGHLALLGVGIVALVAGWLRIGYFVGFVLASAALLMWLAPQL